MLVTNPERNLPFWSDGGDLGVKNRVFFGDVSLMKMDARWRFGVAFRVELQMIFRHGLKRREINRRVDQKHVAICFQVLKGWKTFPYGFSGPFP